MSKVTCPKCGHPFYPPVRTTGKYSQNHSIHGFGDQIAQWMDDGTSKGDVIAEAARRADLPSFLNKFGRVVYKHESSWTKEEASRVIDALRLIAEFLDCPLVEIHE